MIERFVEPYNAKDIDGLMALYAPDAEVFFFTFPPARGLRQIRAIWEWDFRAFPETTDSPIPADRVPCGDLFGTAAS
jgi:ketosteroid isomerase-like protein